MNIEKFKVTITLLLFVAFGLDHNHTLFLYQKINCICIWYNNLIRTITYCASCWTSWTSDMFQAREAALKNSLGPSFQNIQPLRLASLPPLKESPAWPVVRAGTGIRNKPGRLSLPVDRERRQVVAGVVKGALLRPYLSTLPAFPLPLCIPRYLIFLWLSGSLSP